jgi:hypothetical protein
MTAGGGLEVAMAALELELASGLPTMVVRTEPPSAERAERKDAAACGLRTVVVANTVTDGDGEASGVTVTVTVASPSSPVAVPDAVTVKVVVALKAFEAGVVVARVGTEVVVGVEPDEELSLSQVSSPLSSSPLSSSPVSGSHVSSPDSSPLSSVSGSQVSSDALGSDTAMSSVAPVAWMMDKAFLSLVQVTFCSGRVRGDTIEIISWQDLRHRSGRCEE